MTILLPILMLLVLAAVVGFTYTEGFWSNTVRFVNVVFAGLIAMNFFEPLAAWIESMSSDLAGFTYFWDFICLWLLFALSMVILRLATNALSAVKVRFLGVVDRAGGVAMAVLVGWVMVAFTLTTLHTAPLAQKFLWGGFDYTTGMFFGLAPDRHWLGFVRHVSQGSYSQSGSPSVFDAGGFFMPKYAMRRAEFEKLAESGSMRTTTPPKR